MGGPFVADPAVFMSTPKRKNSNRRSKMVRAGLRKKPISLRTCDRCGHMGTPHRVCENCGFYAGRQVIDMDGA